MYNSTDPSNPGLSIRRRWRLFHECSSLAHHLDYSSASYRLNCKELLYKIVDAFVFYTLHWERNTIPFWHVELYCCATCCATGHSTERIVLTLNAVDCKLKALSTSMVALEPACSTKQQCCVVPALMCYHAAFEYQENASLVITCYCFRGRGPMTAFLLLPKPCVLRVLATMPEPPRQLTQISAVFFFICSSQGKNCPRLWKCLASSDFVSARGTFFHLKYSIISTNINPTAVPEDSSKAQAAAYLKSHRSSAFVSNAQTKSRLAVPSTLNCENEHPGPLRSTACHVNGTVWTSQCMH